jgi:hypothetical protein
MPVAYKTIPIYTCLQCDHSWMPTKYIDTLPKQCTRCQSTKWNTK